MFILVDCIITNGIIECQTHKIEVSKRCKQKYEYLNIFTF